MEKFVIMPKFETAEEFEKWLSELKPEDFNLELVDLEVVPVDEEEGE